jgi:cellulose synthase/poly-beta-1,6-N-acetylglucosamine synthase-like glycosyltransferase
VNRRSLLGTLIAILAVSLLAGGIYVVASGSFRRSLSLGIYLLANMVVFADLLDFAVRFAVRRRTNPLTSIPLQVGTFNALQVDLHLKPYAVIASLFNAEAILDEFLETMAPFRDRLFVIDDSSTDQTYLRLRRAGIHCIQGDRNRKKPGAIRELLRVLPREIETVVVIDPDARILTSPEGTTLELERAIFEFQRSGMAAACPRLMVREDGWIGRFQEVEYALAFLVGRHSLGDHAVTSGISVYRRDALQDALENHTLSVYAEDLRNALLMLGSGERIYYDGRLMIETEAKRSLRSWFSQRVGWFYGLLKVYTENFGDVLRVASRRPFLAYHYLVYLGVLTLMLHPLKIVALVILSVSVLNAFDNLLVLGWIPDTAATDPLYFLLAYMKYTVLIGAVILLVVPRRERARLLWTTPAYFFYALLHIIPITLGYLNWISLKLFGRRMYRDHFQDEESVREELEPV